MSQSEIKLMYESMVENGDLANLFPNLTGEWALDREEFSDQYSINEDLIENMKSDEEI